MVSYENGHYYLTSDANVKYEMTGKDLKKYVGKKIVISGTTQAVATPTGDATLAVSVGSIAVNGAAAGLSATTLVIISGVVVGAGAGIGVGVYEATQSSTSASR
jgi:hypothetical protein